MESQTLLLRKKLCTICPGDMRRWVKLTIEGKSSEKGSRSIIQKMVAAGPDGRCGASELEEDDPWAAGRMEAPDPWEDALE